MNRRSFIAGSVGAVTAFPWIWTKLTRHTGASPVDVVLRGALVFDGTGAPPVAADVLIEGDRIVAVGGSVTAPGTTVVDLSGLALAPGFIDIHSHTDLALLVDYRAESKIRQGVTTEVTGQDGSSIGPWTDGRYRRIRDAYRDRYDVHIDFTDLPGFFARLEHEPGAVNLASMIGTGTVREYVVGLEDRPATGSERTHMAALVAQALDAGACGVSSGLEYLPDAFATLDELVALAGVLQGKSLPYAAHIRNEDDQLFAAIEETLNVGRLARVPVHVSHLKAQGHRNWWKAEQALDMIAHARADGIEATFDRYPYAAYSTGLSSLFPVWAREGGTDAFLARLADPAKQAQIEGAVREKVQKLGSWDAVQITSTANEALEWARGRRLGLLATERNQDPYALLLEIIREDRSRAGMIGFGMSDENTERILKHPLGMVCSDAGALAIQGPLSTGVPHPRAYGSFPRLLGHYCRDRRLMPLEIAIHKITAMPADKLQLAGRGRIVSGAFADLVAFDPDTIVDRASFENPHQYPSGIPHVMVNGEWVVWEGEHTGARPGRVVRPARQSHGLH